MLGLYEEAFRRFLLGEAPFPNHVLLVVTLSETQDNLNNRNMALPHGGERTEHGRHYQFVIPGIMFVVIVGKAITPEMRQIGTWPNGFVYIATKGEARKLTALVSATKDAQRRGKLLKDLGPRQSR